MATPSILFLLTILLASSSFGQDTATIVQIVRQADPKAAWVTPSAISFGTPLSSTQLNATAAVSGKFVYQPSAGTILAPGQDTLTVNFVPDDPNFLTRTISVVLTVIPSAVPSFSFMLTTQSTTQQPIPVQSGKSSPIHLVIQPVLSVPETIVFSCPHPPSESVCVFTPSTVQLASQLSSVDLSLVPAHGNYLLPRSALRSAWPRETASGHSPQTGKTILYPAILFLGCLLNFVRRRVCTCSRLSLGMATVIFLVVPAASLLGCGSGFYSLQHTTVTVVASSGFESHSVDIQLTVVD